MNIGAAGIKTSKSSKPEQSLTIENKYPSWFNKRTQYKLPRGRGVDPSLYYSYAKLQGIYSVFLKVQENMVYLANVVPFSAGFWDYNGIYSEFIPDFHFQFPYDFSLTFQSKNFP